MDTGTVSDPVVGDLFGTFPKIGEPQFRPQNTIVLITGTPKKASLILGNPHLELVAEPGWLAPMNTAKIDLQTLSVRLSQQRSVFMGPRTRASSTQALPATFQ